MNAANYTFAACSHTTTMKRLADAAFDADRIHAAFLPEGVARVDCVSRRGRGASACLRAFVEACAIA